ncbi:PIN domain-containing protein [Nonomuraea maritima]|uniref:PIN domain-containing protein n=1 Tax=Nonomuraea maritima TaxID=683260 RepID=UPI0015A15081|nr:PIN domain-containing protein [Nonomuraea maritima]
MTAGIGTVLRCGVPKVVGSLGLLLSAPRARQFVPADGDAAELLVGVEMADAARRPNRQAFVDEVLALIPVEEYTTDVASVHARLMAHVRGEGQSRGAYDLLIAATAAATARTVITMDASAAFDDLPGVRAQVVPR